ncbi:MAG: hypothetical protein JXR70_05805 [Spirochaetales bacterium]|nr:hypothetical protein [Spirochaetales bacterium]
MDKTCDKASERDQVVNKTGENEDPYMIDTPLGKLCRRHGVDKNSRRKESAVKYYQKGNVRSVPLNEPADISTPLGTMTAELVTFYESGQIRRIFPLDGKLTGFWTEANEYQLAQILSLKTPAGHIFVKAIYIEFYKVGALKSILFWPMERVALSTPAGEIMARKGISFYESGALKNIEPCEEITIKSPIGPIKAFQPDPEGLMAEESGICFDTSGHVLSVYSVKSEIHVILESEVEKVFSPRMVPSYCDESAWFIEPIQIIFEKDMVVFKSKNIYLDMVPLCSRFTVKDYIAPRPAAEILCQA